MKFRPCIDLREGKVTQIVGETLSSEQITSNFISDKKAQDFADLYKADGVTGGHVIMLDELSKSAACDALSTFPQGLQIGGGITPQNSLEYLFAGASHVIVTSYLFNEGVFQPNKLNELSSLVGRENLVVDLSCKKIGSHVYVMSDKWETQTDLQITSDSLDDVASHCDEFLLHAVDVEGKCKGIEASVANVFGSWAQTRNFPVTYAGGVTTANDIITLQKVGNGFLDYSVGSALDIFGGTTLRYRDLIPGW